MCGIEGFSLSIDNTYEYGQSHYTVPVHKHHKSIPGSVDLGCNHVISIMLYLFIMQCHVIYT